MTCIKLTLMGRRNSRRTLSLDSASVFKFLSYPWRWWRCSRKLFKNFISSVCQCEFIHVQRFSRQCHYYCFISQLCNHYFILYNLHTLFFPFVYLCSLFSVFASFPFSLLFLSYLSIPPSFLSILVSLLSHNNTCLHSRFLITLQTVALCSSKGQNVHRSHKGMNSSEHLDIHLFLGCSWSALPCPRLNQRFIRLTT